MKTLKKLTALSFVLFASTMANAQDIIVKNAAGEQTVPQNPQKVVVLDFGVADTLRALGETDKIVGFPKVGHIPTYLDEFKQDKFKDVGSLPEPAFESINELNPDLIIAAPRQQKLLDKLKEIAPVFYVENDYSNYYPSFQENVTALGKILQVANETKGKTALLVLVNESKISTFGDNSRYSMVFQKFGFKPADPNIKSSTHGMSVGFEYLLEKNPDYLLVVDRTAAVTDKVNNAQKVLDNAIVQQTNAYKNKHIIYLDAANWYLAFGGLESMEVIAAELEKAIK
ncbi:MAG: ABC transporter substrate-binding protein [Haemophilus haemolyticus]|nr:ABC transporter substrate-binding protein [Haemophilus haemolyticus]